MTHERRGETEKTRSNTSQLRRGEREYGEEAGVEGIRYKYDVGNDGKEHVWVEPADGKKDKANSRGLGGKPQFLPKVNGEVEEYKNERRMELNE